MVNFNNFFRVIFFLFVVACGGSDIIAQPGFESRVHSEAPIIFEYGVKMSPQLTVHFKERVFDLAAGVATASRNQMENAFTDLNDYFSDLEQKYGSITFIKQIPGAVWGDIWRRNKRTGDLVQLHDMSQLFTVHFNRFVPIDSIIRELEQMEEVLYAHQPIQTVRLADPNDPCLHDISNCVAGETGDQWNLFKIDAPAAWDITRGLPEIVVGIIEDARGTNSGVPQRDHPDFILPDETSKFVPGLGNFSAVPDPHSTHVAGIVGAATDDGDGIASLGWNIRMVPYRFTGYGSGADGLVTKINTAWEIDTVEVINCSFVTVSTTGVPIIPNSHCFYFVPTNYQSVESEIANAINVGEVVVVAGTGNTGFELTNGHEECAQFLPLIPYIPWPAAYPGVIGVSATDIYDVFAGGRDYNYWDPALEQLNFVDVAAPGIDILSTQIGSSYRIASGTSFSSPHVAALAGLILSINSYTPAEVQQFITSSALDLGTSGNDGYFGHGRINAYEALKEAFPIKITGDITTNTNWVSGDYALFKNPNVPPTTVQYFVDGVDLTIGAGAVVVVEEKVRVLAINGGHITIDPGATIIEEPGGEIIAGSGGFVTDNGGDIRFGGTGACMATAGGILKFASGVTRTVDNGGVIASFGSGGSIEIEDNADLVFESNSKLFLEPGALVKLGDNAEITIESEIDAQGTMANPITFTSLYPSPSSGQYWKWLKITGSGQDENMGIIKHAMISYADYGIHATQVPDLAIENSTIQNCRVNSLYLYNSYADIDNNQILNSGISNGVYLYNSSPVFYNNTINDNAGAGVFCYNYSSPEFGASTSTVYGANVLAGNAYGISAFYYSNPFLGEEIQLEGPVVLYGGYNSIYGNSSFAVKAEQNCDITAQYNWWSRYPVDPEIFDIEEGCTIDYSNALPFDPNQESSALAGGSSLSERSGSSLLPTENFTPRQLLKLAKKFRVQKRPGLALPVYKQLILNYPNRVEARWGLIELVSTFKEAERDSAVAYLLHTIVTHPNLKMQRVAFDMLTGEYLEKRNANSAVANAQQVVSNYPNTESEKTALFDLVNIYFHNLNDPAQAQTYLSSLESKYSNDELTFHAQMLMGSGILAKPSTRNRIPLGKPGDKKDDPDLASNPATFSLSQNYPNPFNPSTTIEFSLPENQLVDISIFSVNGQRIITLVNGFLERGNHTIQWDGKDELGTPVASGIYIIRLKAGDKWYARKMMLLK